MSVLSLKIDVLSPTRTLSPFIDGRAEFIKQKPLLVSCYRYSLVFQDFTPDRKIIKSQCPEYIPSLVPTHIPALTEYQERYLEVAVSQIAEHNETIMMQDVTSRVSPHVTNTDHAPPSDHSCPIYIFLFISWYFVMIPYTVRTAQRTAVSEFLLTCFPIYIHQEP